MKIGIWRAFVCSQLFFWAVSAALAEERLSAAVLVDAVIQANPQLEAASAAYLAERAAAKMQGRLADPNLMIGLAPDTVGDELGTRTLLKLSQALPWPGKRGLQRDAATAAAAVSEQEALAVTRQLALAAQSAWAEWWYAHHALVINQRTIDSYTLLVEASETRYQNGSGRQQDVLQSSLRLRHAEHQQIELQQQKRRTGIAINTLLNRAPNEALLAPADLPTTATLPEEQALKQDLEQEWEQALLAHPQYQRAEAQQRSAALKLRLAKRDRYPDFVAEVSHIGTLDPEEKRLQLGLGIKLPFDQGKRKHGIAAADAALRSNLAAQQQALAILRQRLASLLSRFHEHQHIVQLYSGDLLTLASRARQAAERDYANGISDFNAVTMAITDLQTTEQRLRRHQANLFITAAELEELLGGALDVRK